MKTVDLSLTEEEADVLMGVLVHELVKKYTTDPSSMTAVEVEHATRHHRRISVLIDKLDVNMKNLNSKMR